MGEAGILLTLVAGIGAAVVFQNLLRLRDNDEFPADELLTNELKSAAALVTGESDSGRPITISSTGRFFASSSMVLFFFRACAFTVRVSSVGSSALLS